MGTKRIYEPAGSDDGFRVRVDRVWPRGVSKTDARIDGWLKGGRVQGALRVELAGQGEVIALLDEMRRDKKVTLLFAARDEEHHNAVTLKEYLTARAP